MENFQADKPETMFKIFVFMGCKHCGKSTQGRTYAEKIGAEFYDLDQVIEKNIGMTVRDYFLKYGNEKFKYEETKACLQLAEKCQPAVCQSLEKCKPVEKPVNKLSETPVHQPSGCLLSDRLDIKSCKKIVISTGGGICDNTEAMLVLKNIKNTSFVYLRLDTEYSVNRVLDKITEVQEGVYIGVPAYLADKEGNFPPTLKEIKEKLTEKFNIRGEKYTKNADIIIDIKNAPKEDNFKTILGALQN